MLNLLAAASGGFFAKPMKTDQIYWYVDGRFMLRMIDEILIAPYGALRA